MNQETRVSADDSLPPISSESHSIAESLLKEGLFNPPSSPGSAGRLDRFEILRPLREGGMGQVLLAREPVTNGVVAIKVIKPQFVHNPKVVERFLTEARHMYRMAHPNILKVMEVSSRAEGPYYVMPYVAEGNLGSRIQRDGKLQTPFILKIALQIAEALQYAHGKGIIHRDLKPDNILVDAREHAYLTDFGLVRTVFNDSDVNVQGGEIAGTAPYISPSMAKGQAEDTRCDIYSFGALLYEMLAGAPPYEGDDTDAVLAQVLKGPPRPIRDRNPAAPPDLVRIAEGAMARELRDRYAQMADIIKDLKRVEQSRPPLGPHGGESPRRLKAALGIAVLAVGLGLAGWIWLNRSGNILPRFPGNGNQVVPPEVSPAPKILYPVALFTFEDRGEGTVKRSDIVSDKMFAALAQYPDLYLVDRLEIQKLMDEQGLSLAGLSPTEQAVQAGKCVGAKIIIVGSVIEADHSLQLIAKIIGTETTRVLAESVSGTLDEPLDTLIKRLAEQVARVVEKDKDKICLTEPTPADRSAALRSAVGTGKKPLLQLGAIDLEGQRVNQSPVGNEFSRICRETGFDILEANTPGESKALILISGKGLSEVLGHRGALVSARAWVELKAVERKTGKILAVERQTVAVIDASEKIARQMALDKASAMTAERILPPLVK